MDREKKPEFPFVNCNTITGTIKQQCSNQRFLAINFLDELKQIRDFLWREISTSFDNSSDGHNVELNRFHQEVAYGILAELVAHVLKMNIEADGDFSNMYTMVMDIFCYLTAVCSVELMPYLFSTFASLLLYFNEQPSTTSSELQEEVKHRLCYYMFPLCLAHHRSEGSFCDSMVPSILSSVLDTCDEDSSWCTQTMDLLMLLKRNICLDILSLISSGTESVRKQAKRILMQYWLRTDGRVDSEETLKGWNPPKCSCMDVAELVCINPACVTHSKIAPNKMMHHLCKSCDNGACDDHLFSTARPLGIQDCLSGPCQLEGCHETAVLTCFDTNCISLVKGNQQFVRMCCTCAARHHTNIDSHHIYQEGLRCPWTCENRLVSVAFLGALSKLLEDMLSADLSKQDDQDTMATVILLDQYCQYPIYPPDDDMHNWMVRLVSMVLNWLYNMAQSGQQQSSVAEKRVVTWLTGVLNQDSEYIAEALLPNLPDYAQVGNLWESDHSTIDRRKRTLGIIELLQSQILTGKEAEGFYLVFNVIMPYWLKELNSSLGQLDSLQDSFKKLFQVGSEGIQLERKRKFGFIKDVFDEDDGEKTREALSWLQVLTKMNISIPFIRHIIEKAVQKPGRSKMSSFDVESSKSRPVLRRKSSLSDSEFSDSSTGGLMTQSSFEYVGEVLDVNSTLTRYILMLDIWLSQIRAVEDSVNFQFSVIQSIVLSMLKESSSWGSLHNHDRPSEICLLCHAIMLWFNLTNLIFETYTIQEAVVQSLDEEEEPVAMMHRPSRQSFFNKRFLINFKKRTQHVIQEDCPGSEGSSAEQEARISGASTTVRANTLSPVHMDSPKTLSRERKIARMDTHRNYCYTSLVPDDPKPKTSEKDTGTLYQIFQQCLRLWNHKKPHTFIPEVTHQIILFITTLFQYNKLLQDEASFSIYIQDVEKLIINLWSSLVCESSYLAKAAVNLLVICLELLPTDEQAKDADADLQQSMFRLMANNKFEQDSYTKRFEAVEKAFLMVQFMEDVRKLTVQTHLSLSCVFCHLVGSLQDSSSYVATRAEYCLRALKPSAIEAIQHAMTSAFNNYSGYRSLILMTISMLNSTLPNIPASPIKFFIGLSPYYTLLDMSHVLEEDVHTVQRRVRKKARGISVTADKVSLTGHYSLDALHKYLKKDPSNSAILQQMLALLLQILAHPSFKSSLLNETIDVPALMVTPAPKASALILSFFQLVVCHHFLTQPEQLRESYFFETYLRNVYQVLDVNTEFGNSPEVLLFNMQLLIFSVCPNYKYEAFLKSIKDKPNKNNISLALLDPNLCPAWLKVFFVICYKYTDLIFQSDECSKLQERVQGCLEISLKTLESVPHHCIPPPQAQTSPSVATNQDHGLVFSAMSSRNTSVASLESCSSVPVNAKQLDANKCPLCDSLVNTYNEETITQCIITVATALHHMPIVTSVYLSRVIKALGRVAIPDYFSWENVKNKNCNPTAVSNVAKQYLKCLLTQFGDRKLFLYLFKFSITDNNNKALMQAIATSLPPSVEQDKSVGQSEDENKTDKPVLTQLSPVQYFLEDLPEDTSILQKPDVIINLSNYLELLKDGKNNLSSLLAPFDYFFEKVKELPKNAITKDSFTSLLHIMIFVTNILADNPPKHTSVTLSVLPHQLSSQFCGILMTGLKRTLVPVHALVVLCSSWYRFVDPQSSNFLPLDNLIKMLSNELIQGLKMKTACNINPANFTILLKFFILSFHGNIGYIDDSFNERKVIFCRELQVPHQYFDYVSNHPVILQILLGCLGCLCSQSRIVVLWPNIHEYKLHVAQLVVVNICSGSPSEHIVKVLQRLTDEAASPRRSEDRPPSSIFKIGASFFITMGWMMLASMKLAVMRRIFEEQLSLSEEADNYNFLGQIWPDKQDEMMRKIHSAVESILLLSAEDVQEKDTKYLFLFLEIWTVYLEVAIPRAQHGTVVVDLWNTVIQKISKLPAVDPFLSVLEHLNKAVLHIRKADLSLTNQIIPFWRETKLMTDKAQYCTDLWSSDSDLNETNFGGNDSDDQAKNCCSGQHGLDPWYNCTLHRLTHIDGDYQTDIIGLQS